MMSTAMFGVIATVVALALFIPVVIVVVDQVGTLASNNPVGTLVAFVAAVALVWGMMKVWRFWR